MGRGQSLRGTIEAQDVREHPPERRTQRTAGLREQRRDTGPRPLEPRAIDAARERHLARHARDIQLCEELDKTRIRAVVENEEPGVDGKPNPFERNVDGRGVPTEAGLASNSVTAWPCRCKSQALPSPAMPAPTIAMRTVRDPFTDAYSPPTLAVSPLRCPRGGGIRALGRLGGAHDSPREPAESALSCAASS